MTKVASAGMSRASKACRWFSCFTASSLLVAGVIACTEKDEAPQVLAPLPPGPPIERADPYARSPSRFGAVHLHAGFNPDPRVVEGIAVGEVLASSVHRRCKGWISENPDYLLKAHTAFLRLHLLSRSRHGVSLIVRKPDGSVACSRRSEKDPMLRSDFPIGASQVWIGVESEGASAAYRLGFSEVTWRSSSMPLPEEN